MRNLLLAVLLAIPCTAHAVRLDLVTYTAGGGTDIRPLSNTWSGLFNDFGSSGEVLFSSGTNSWSWRAVSGSSLNFTTSLLSGTSYYYLAYDGKIRMGLNMSADPGYDLVAGLIRATDTVKASTGVFDNAQVGALQVSTLTVTDLFIAPNSTVTVAALTAGSTIQSPLVLGATIQTYFADVSTVSADYVTSDYGEFLRTDSGEYYENGRKGSLVPSGLVFISTTICPSGFTEVTEAQGLYLVGVPSGGTTAGTVGGAMSNLSDATHFHGSQTVQSGTGVTVGDDTPVARSAIAPYIQVRLCQSP